MMPGTKDYKTALEQIYGKPGLPEGCQPVVDLLGRKIKEQDVAAKVGEVGVTAEEKKERKIVVFRDHVLEFPELYYKIHLVGPPEDCRGFAQLFARASCSRADGIEDADLVVFTGGPDVDPAYYGQKPHYSYCGDEERDNSDLAAYLYCMDNGIPMTGVCRGAQFGAVMNGASLWQDINNHQGDHKLYDLKKHCVLEKISSVHHQCVMAGAKGMEVIGIAHESDVKWKDDAEKTTGKTSDIEAFFFRETCFFGVQGHPEYRGYNAFAKWYLDYIYEFVTLNPDLEWVNQRRRLNPDYLVERELIESAENNDVQKERPVLTIVENERN
jgi:gamma-glutamyl-gamma-aminobutyrate hydrolase PuuD